MQEAMLRLHTYTRDGGQVHNPQAFLARTVLNLAVDAHRRSRVDLHEPLDELNLIDLSPAPEEILAAEERLKRMQEALDRANPRMREVFFMHRLDGFSHAEIAQRLHISVSGVEKYIASAVTLLAIERERT